MIKALVPLAEGCEEIEAVTLIDTFRRAGWEVTAAGLQAGALTASRGVTLLPDTTLDRVTAQDFDIIALPGGLGGMENLRKDARILEIIRTFHEQGKWVAAVCAAPLVLEAAGILRGTRITSYPSARDGFSHVDYQDARVVRDGTIVTSRGPGTSLEFALALVGIIDSEEKARELADGMLTPYPEVS